MIDQANKLRDLVRANKNTEIAEEPEVTPIRRSQLSARVITVTSGKGGVGKTNFTINLAIQMAKKGKRVVIIDADFGLANIDVLFGLIPKYSFADVLLGNKTIAEVLTPGPLGIQFVSGGSGLGELANITEKQMAYLLDNFAFLDEIADVVLIDTGAGISNSVVNFIKASHETIIITTPEPTSVTDAYAIMKTVNEDRVYQPQFKIVVNRVEELAEGKEIFDKLNMVTQRFLSLTLSELGTIPYDNQLVKAVKRQQPVSTYFPNASSTKSIENISNKLLSINTQDNNQPHEGIRFFMKRLANIFGN